MEDHNTMYELLLVVFDLFHNLEGTVGFPIFSQNIKILKNTKILENVEILQKNIKITILKI